MKNKLFTLMLIVCSSLFLVNCAKNNSSGTNNAGVNAYGTCTTAGYVNTQYGCAPQSSNCQAGYGYINGGCYPPTTGTTGIYGNSCQAGYVMTQYGCGQQTTMCGANYMSMGYVNGQCYPITYSGTTGQTCQVGYVGTVMGCLPQGSCPSGYGYYYGSYNGQVGGWCYQRTY